MLKILIKVIVDFKNLIDKNLINIQICKMGKHMNNPKRKNNLLFRQYVKKENI